MSPPVKRTGARRERAQRTRARVVRAAHALFCARGYTGTRMTDVAAAAGVAVQTVYFTFHTKSELLQACYERAVLGEEDPTPPERQPFYLAFMQATSGREALGHFAAGNSAIAARVARLDGVMHGALHEPEAIAVRERSEALRRAGYRSMIASLDARFGLRDGLTIDTATDITLMLGGHAAYVQLVHDYGWRQEQFVPWLADALAGLLLSGA